MKKLKYILLLIIISICSTQKEVQAQSSFTNSGYGLLSGATQLGSGYLTIGSSYDDVKVTSTWDTVILFKGVDTVFHEHTFVSKSNNKGNTFSSCAVAHGPAGCNYNWVDNDLICTMCLRNLNVKEIRSSITIKKIDPYQDAKDRLNKLKNK